MSRGRPASLADTLLWTALSAGLLVLSFPRLGIFPLAWIALVPWLGISRKLPLRQALLASLGLGFFYFGGLLYWVALFGCVPWLLLSLFQSFFIAAAGLGVWLCRHLNRWWRILAAASLWVVFEWLRGRGPFGFTWGWLGYSQSPWRGLIQIVSVTGVPGLSFLIVLHNAALAEGLRFGETRLIRRLVPLGAAWGLILLVALFGRCRAEALARVSRSLKVSIVQPAAREPRPEDIGHFWPKEDLRQEQALLKALTQEAALQRPELIVWPESAVPAVLNGDEALLSWVGEMAREGGCWLLLGAAYGDRAGNMYNSAYLLSPEGRLAGHYEKVQLVPFGEFVPGRNWLPGLRYYPIREYDLAAGSGFHTLQGGRNRLGVSICFESIFPHISRSFARQGANLLVIITNDGWFRRTAAPAQHRQMAVFRAVETGRWVARAALTGISCVISPRGEILQELGIYQRGVLTERVGAGEGLTFYTRRGDWFIALCGLLAAAGIVQSLRLKITHPRAE